MLLFVFDFFRKLLNISKQFVKLIVFCKLLGNQSNFFLFFFCDGRIFRKLTANFCGFFKPGFFCFKFRSTAIYFLHEFFTLFLLCECDRYIAQFVLNYDFFPFAVCDFLRISLRKPSDKHNEFFVCGVCIDCFVYGNAQFIIALYRYTSKIIAKTSGKHFPFFFKFRFILLHSFKKTLVVSC